MSQWHFPKLVPLNEEFPASAQSLKSLASSLTKTTFLKTHLSGAESHPILSEFSSLRLSKYSIRPSFSQLEQLVQDFILLVK
jgi:hypothetical protein